MARAFYESGIHATIAGVILAVDLVLAGVYMYGYTELVPQSQALSFFQLVKVVPKQMYVFGAIGTAIVIFAVSGWNMVKLASGGKSLFRQSVRGGAPALAPNVLRRRSA